MASPHVDFAGPRAGVLSASDAPDVAELFRTYAPYVAAIALRLLGREDEVDDVVQDVFVSALRGVHRLREAGALRGWLATVTVRVARRRLRMRRLRALVGLDRAVDYETMIAPGASPEDRAFLARVYRALDTLPVAQRLAWTLRHIHGDSLDTVAEACGCSLATVKRRIAAAHAAIEGMVGP
jgi:RNA polymerase sigma-70 factor (ECF subfamily)